MPAILKGWFDRVIIQGFAYSLATIYEQGPFQVGGRAGGWGGTPGAGLAPCCGSYTPCLPACRLQKKKAMLSFTTSGMESMYTPRGINGDMNVLLWPMQVLAPQICYSVQYVTPEARAQMLSAWQERLATIWEEKPLSIVPNSYFELGMEGGFMLKQEVLAQQEGKEQGLTVGQHLGKAFPPNQQLKAP
ncbi:NAD(P)H dehydrogenase [quinone] 1 isoform X3 [Aix galericulata]|nr:NAD(P)H dehydrogenase [quinone] 1 isoform X3 [Aix galericulata]